MYRPQPVEADDLVKGRQHAVNIPGDVVPGVGHVAGVQAYAHLLRQRHPVQYLPQLLKPAAHLAALARHGLQQHGGADVRRENGVERVGDLGDARLHPLAGVAAGVEVVHVAGDIFHPLQVVRHGHPGKLPGVLVLGAGVDGVGRVGHDGAEAVFLRQGPKGRRVGAVNGFRFTAPWVPGEKLEGVGPQGQGCLPHGQKAVGGGEMASDVQHVLLLYSRYVAHSSLSRVAVMTP